MPAGRPPKYNTPEEMQADIDLYFLVVKSNKAEDPTLLSNLSEEELNKISDIDEEIPLVSGLAYMLDMSTEAFRKYKYKEEFVATVKRAKQRIERSLENRLAGNAVVGSIFNLKNNFGWKDKTETEHSGGFTVKIPQKDAETL